MLLFLFVISNKGTNDLLLCRTVHYFLTILQILLITVLPYFINKVIILKLSGNLFQVIGYTCIHHFISRL